MDIKTNVNDFLMLNFNWHPTLTPEVTTCYFAPICEHNSFPPYSLNTTHHHWRVCPNTDCYDVRHFVL